jgi:glycerol-3-phosphate acyltransferase PlsX
MKIGFDIMGGDFAPGEGINGLERYFADGGTAEVVLFGSEEALETPTLLPFIQDGRIAVVHAPDVIHMNEHPARALKEKPKSSISVGFQHLSSGGIDAFISAGNTGAMLVGSLYALRPIEGVIRPAISTLIPKASGGTGLLLDVGLNSDCKPEILNQFAVMGTEYARTILGIEQPRVGLLTIGEEEGKGNLLAQATYPILKANEYIHFIGNIEGRDIFNDVADIMVCDGFTGNIILKMAESLFTITQEKGIQHEYFERFNFENYGGTPVLGIAKPVIIGHGISRGRAFQNMISLAGKMVERNVMLKLQDALTS